MVVGWRWMKWLGSGYDRLNSTYMRERQRDTTCSSISEVAAPGMITNSLPLLADFVQ